MVYASAAITTIFWIALIKVGLVAGAILVAAVELLQVTVI